ncbi:hypothetical protein SAMN06295900_104393 [Trinickia caryophylli]|uniref:Uncharacterized protein n=1 Tax=Trinickia caryophylli TaxID=28094 RepID=A0A1X7E2P3_TRICW|nr:hypothetical protein SAMN06295900_104393 [Trinickia caryophylli]
MARRAPSQRALECAGHLGVAVVCAPCSQRFVPCETHCVTRSARVPGRADRRASVAAAG